VVLARGTRVDADDLPPEVSVAVPDPVVATDVRPLADVERGYITAVLGAVGGNRTQAAARLGIGPATLYRKLKAYGISARGTS
jgi:DNA-binding NtrC family response regulator